MRVRPLMVSLLLLAASMRADGASPGGRLPWFWEHLAYHAGEAALDLHQARQLKIPGVMSRRLVQRCHERIVAAVAACARGERPGPIGCSGPLARSAEALGRAGDGAEPAAPAAAHLGASAGRLALLVRTVRRARERMCRPGVPSTVVPAMATRFDNGRRLVLEPVTPLAFGTRYRLRLPASLQVGDLATRFTTDGRLAPEPATGSEDNPVLRFVARTLGAGAAQDGVTVRPQLLLRYGPPLALRQVVLGRGLGFEPVDDATTIAGTFRTVQPPLVADAGRIADAAPSVWPPVALAPDSAEAHGLGVPPAGLPHVATVVQGSIDLPDPVSGASEVVPYWITLPAHPAPTHPIVLLLHGLNGSGSALLFQHAEALATRGLAAAAFDFPLHGRRKGAVVFLDPLDAAAFAEHLRRAVDDTLTVAAGLRSGRMLPAGTAPTGPVRVLGYSLGAMVGSIALGLDPQLGTSALMAPAGDHTDWLWLPVLQALAVPPLGCIGGPMHGVVCKAAADCGGAPCGANPVVEHLLLRYTMSYRSAVASVDPQGFAARLAGPERRRAVLIEEGAVDGIVVSRATEWLAAAGQVDPTCRIRPDAPQTLCRFPGAGHELEGLPEVRKLAYAFLESDGRELGDGRTARADLAAR